MQGFRQILLRDLRLAVRQGMDAFMAVTFFVIAGALFPLGVGPEPGVLARIAGGVIWVTALLAVLLSLDRLFQQDFEDGSLDLLVLAPMPLEATVTAKAAAHWLTTFAAHCRRYVGDGYLAAAITAEEKLAWLRAKGTSGEAA